MVITSRDEERGLSAVQSLIEAREGSEESEESEGSIRFEQLDLASLQSVDELVGRLSDGSEKGVFLGNLDCLINNAGMIAPHFSRTVDGMEAVLQVNHVGHQYLTQQVLATAAGKTHPRVVSVSSWHGAAWFAPSYCDTLQLSRESYGMFTAYGVSKLANVRFVRHLATMGIEALAVHPGTPLVHLKCALSFSDPSLRLAYFQRNGRNRVRRATDERAGFGSSAGRKPAFLAVPQPHRQDSQPGRRVHRLRRTGPAAQADKCKRVEDVGVSARQR